MVTIPFDLTSTTRHNPGWNLIQCNLLKQIPLSTAHGNYDR